MECKQVIEQLSQLIDQKLSPQEKSEMLMHLASCEKCNKEYQALCAMVKELNHMQEVPLPQGFDQELREKLIAAKNQMEKEHASNVTAFPLIAKEKKKKPIWKKYSAIAAVFAVMLITTSTIWFMEQNDVLPNAALYGGAAEDQGIIVPTDALSKDASTLEESKNTELSQDIKSKTENEVENAQVQQSGQTPKNMQAGPNRTEPFLGAADNANATSGANAENAEQAMVSSAGSLPPENGATGFRSMPNQVEYTTESATELAKIYVQDLKNKTEKAETVKAYEAAFDLNTLEYVYQGQSANQYHMFTIKGTKDKNPAEHTITTVPKNGTIVVEDSWVK